MTKITKDNDINDRTSAVYAENPTKPSWTIEQGVIYDENGRLTMQPIEQVQSKPKIKYNCHYRSG